MMVRFGMAAALAAVAVPALAQQTRVNAVGPVRGDSLTITVRRLSDTSIRRLHEEVQALRAANRRRESQFMLMLADTARARQAMFLEEEMVRVTLELIRKDSDLQVACMMVAPRSFEIPGTLGIDVDTTDSALFDLARDERGRTRLVMEFRAARPRVHSVAPGSPAEKAGMQPGDVWTSFNGRALSGRVSFDELLNPGSPALLRVLRGGREVELAPVFVAARGTSASSADVCEAAVAAREGAERPLMERAMAGSSPSGERPPTAGARVGAIRQGTLIPPPGGQFFVFTPGGVTMHAGASLQAVDATWRTKMNVKHNGVIVIDIAPGSPAALAGLAHLDVITSVNGVPVTTPAAFQRVAVEHRVLELTIANNDGTTRVVKLAR